jgi:hypothetical protein
MHKIVWANIYAVRANIYDARGAHIEIESASGKGVDAPDVKVELCVFLCRNVRQEGRQQKGERLSNCLFRRVPSLGVSL